MGGKDAIITYLATSNTRKNNIFWIIFFIGKPLPTNIRNFFRSYYYDFILTPISFLKINNNADIKQHIQFFLKITKTFQTNKYTASINMKPTTLDIDNLYQLFCKRYNSINCLSNYAEGIITFQKIKERNE